MESANLTAPKLGSNRLSVRGADEGDEAEIFRLMGRAEHVHLHADWSISADYWQQSGSVVAERNGDLVGFIAATQDPPPIAWIRVLAVAMAEPHYALRTMLPTVICGLRAEGAQTLAVMSASDWIDDEFPRLGFAANHAIEEMIKHDMTIPDVQLGNVIVRSVDSADFSTLAKLDQTSFVDPIWWQSARQFKRAQTDAISFTIAEFNDKAVGYQMSVKGASRQAHLVRMAIDRHYHGHGIASALLAHALRDFDRLGLKKVTLNTQTDNTASHRLYRRFGFETTGKVFKVWTKEI